MNEEGVEFLSGERAERCARAAADIAAETVNMLNAWKQGHGALSSLSGELYRLQGNQYNLTPLYPRSMRATAHFKGRLICLD